MAAHINWIAEVRKKHGDGWALVDQTGDKRNATYFDMFSGNDEFDRMLGHEGYPEDSRMKIAEGANEAYHGWFMLADLFDFNWDTVQTKDGKPLESGRTWRQYLAEVLYGQFSDEDDVKDFLSQFKTWKEIGVERVLHYLDF